MAHTPRRRNDKRPHPLLFTIGTSIGIGTSSGIVTGKVTSVDEGGWIYADWNTPGPPPWLRATQVFKLETQDGTARNQG